MKSYGTFDKKALGWDSWAKCADTHPALPLKDGLVVYGGAALHPVKKDCDVYISFDFGKDTDPRGYPWNPGEFIFFPISDMSVPKDPAEFKKLVLWSIEQIQAGKSVHGGCIGGHGRTGMWLAAIVKEMMGIEDAITYVRQNYCPKAVETHGQVEFLHKYFGIKNVKESKASMVYENEVPVKTKSQTSKFNEKYGKNGTEQAYEVEPFLIKANIWGIPVND